MADARRDDNNVPTWLGISCVDGVTPVRIVINPSNSGVKVDTTTVISVTPAYVGSRDSNQVPVKYGVSDADGSVMLPIYVEPTTGAVLIDL